MTTTRTRPQSSALHPSNPDKQAELTWARESNCLGIRTETFLSEEPDDVAAAASVCQGCVIYDECAAFAAINKPRGVWAGRVWRNEAMTGADV